MPPPIGLVTALASEARTLLGPGALQPVNGHGIQCVTVSPELDVALSSAGVGIGAARTAALGLVAHGVSALVSIGVAGGLVPGIDAGHVILPSQLLQTDGRRILGAWEPDPAVVDGAHQCLSTNGISHRPGTLLTVSEGVLTRDAKAALFAQFRGLAVDMESAAVARVAFEAGLPFFGLRAICDPAEKTVPGALYGWLDDGGKIRPGAIALSLVRRPSLVFEMWTMGRLFSSARKALKQAWQAVLGDRVLQSVAASAACSSSVSGDVERNP